MGARRSEARVDSMRAVSGPGWSPQVGVLALQGDFAAHAAALRRHGCTTSEIRRAEQLAKIDGLVIPGGESTTLLRLLREFALWEPSLSAARAGLPLFGTCAGLILLAERVSNPAQESLGLLPVEVRRNAYGRQVESFVVAGELQVPPDLLRPPLVFGSLAAGSEVGARLPTEFVFIRAPMITALRNGVETLAACEGVPVLVRKDGILAASYHPELSSDALAVALFVALVASRRSPARSAREE